MENISVHLIIIAASVVLILSFFFGEISKRTSIPSVLMLIVLGVLVNLGMEYMGWSVSDKLDKPLEFLGTVGLIMIVLEAALELKLERSKLVPIFLSLGIALVGLVLSAWITAEILYHFIPAFQKECVVQVDGELINQGKLVAWIYATPLSILSSAIIIPSVLELRSDKKEFHIYESTFSDILGIMLFYFLKGMAIIPGKESTGGVGKFAFITIITLIIAIVASYLLVLIFQKISSHTKLFLLIASLLLIYSLAKMQGLSSLLIVLVFGLVISNKDIFFVGILKKWLDKKKADEIYHGLHTITMETAFVVRTFFFVVFGITIVFSTLGSWTVFGISLMCLAVIYIVRFVLLRVSLGKDIVPQLYIAPRGLITILLFYGIAPQLEVAAFSPGIILFIIIGTSLIMTASLIFDKRRANKAINQVRSANISETKWKVPDVK